MSLIHCGILVLVEAAILLLLLDDDEGMPSMLFDFDTRIKKENPCYSDEASQSDCPILRCFLSFAAENEGQTGRVKSMQAMMSICDKVLPKDLTHSLFFPDGGKCFPKQFPIHVDQEYVCP